jgi:hypothetical protein
MCEIVKQIDGFGVVLLNNGIYRRYGFFDELRLIPIKKTDVLFVTGWLQRANTSRSPLANEFVRILTEYTTHD